VRIADVHLAVSRFEVPVLWAALGVGAATIIASAV
jgi:hypothetical protein